MCIQFQQVAIGTGHEHGEIITILHPRLLIEDCRLWQERGETIDPCKSSNAGIHIRGLQWEGIVLRSKCAALWLGGSRGARTVRLIAKGRNCAERIVRDWQKGRGIPRVTIGVIIERETAVHRVKVRKATLIGTIQRGWTLVNVPAVRAVWVNVEGTTDVTSCFGSKHFKQSYR